MDRRKFLATAAAMPAAAMLGGKPPGPTST